jgi:hypothetical protein
VQAEPQQVVGLVGVLDEFLELVQAAGGRDACRIRITNGKGGKDRYVPFPASFRETLALHIAPHLAWYLQLQACLRLSAGKVLPSLHGLP